MDEFYLRWIWLTQRELWVSRVLKIGAFANWGFSVLVDGQQRRPGRLGGGQLVANGQRAVIGLPGWCNSIKEIQSNFNFRFLPFHFLINESGSCGSGKLL